MDLFFLDRLHDLLAVFVRLFFAREFFGVSGYGRRLKLRRAPGGGDLIRGDRTRIVGSREDGPAEYGPGNRSANEDEDDGDDSLGHGSTIVRMK